MFTLRDARKKSDIYTKNGWAGMKLSTLRTQQGTSAAVQVDGGFTLLDAVDVSGLLGASDGLQRAEAARAQGEVQIEADDADFASLVTRPVKIVCCGLNYSDHILEMGRQLPEHPTLFAKFSDTLCGAEDTIRSRASEKVDWEAELAVIVGADLHGASTEQAAAGIAGYAIANDVSMRDWQNRTLQWFQGKAFDATTPLGPVMVTADEFGETPSFDVNGYVNDEQVQHGCTSTLVFPPAALIEYISQFTALRPGDVILTGTPGGVGAGRKPPRFLENGDVLRTEIPGIGILQNRFEITGPTGREPTQTI